MGLERFLTEIRDRDILYVGELHQSREVLSFQMAVLKGLVDGGARPAVALEMFNVSQQELLDGYSSGGLGLEEFFERYVEGPEGFDLRHYLPVVEFAVHGGLRVFGLNIPRDVAAAVARRGLDPEEIRRFGLSEDAIVRCSREYREMLRRAYRRHPHGEITEEHFILAQSIKDEMMSETLAAHLRGAHRGRPLVAITGRGHVDRGLGVPERVRKKTSGTISDVLIVAAYADEPSEPGVADYLLLISG